MKRTNLFHFALLMFIFSSVILGIAGCVAIVDTKAPVETNSDDHVALSKDILVTLGIRGGQ